MADLTRLARYDLVVTKDKSTTDKAQVPAYAQVDFYKQGATVTTDVRVPNYDVDVVITVRDVGRILPGDSLRKWVTSPGVANTNLQISNGSTWKLVTLT